MRAVAALLSLSMLLPFVSLSAQVHRSVVPGARVRVTVPERGLDKSVGTCLALSDGAMLFAADSAADPWTIPVASMKRVDLHAGRKSNALKGLGIGFGAGAAVGAILGAAAARETCGVRGAACVAVGAAVGGVLIAPIGLLFGATTKTDRWEEIPLDHLRASLTPQREGRFGVGLLVRF